LATPSLEQIKNIESKYAKRIIIQQDVSDYGEVSFRILPKRSSWHKSSSDDVPEYYRERKTFPAAERAAIYLLVNYKKIFN